MNPNILSRSIFSCPPPTDSTIFNYFILVTTLVAHIPILLGKVRIIWASLIKARLTHYPSMESIVRRVVSFDYSYPGE